MDVSTNRIGWDDVEINDEYENGSELHTTYMQKDVVKKDDLAERAFNSTIHVFLNAFFDYLTKVSNSRPRRNILLIICAVNVTFAQVLPNYTGRCCCRAGFGILVKRRIPSALMCLGIRLKSKQFQDLSAGFKGVLSATSENLQSQQNQESNKCIVSPRADDNGTNTIAQDIEFKGEDIVKLVLTPIIEGFLDGFNRLHEHNITAPRRIQQDCLDIFDKELLRALRYF
ncbi:hypothetical protein TWF106_006466 [Orbilia oligospora]|uniref:Uncharacterized protein n=1 Tax=Orbilia oligospora TaxID=2813651 RepID=A0A7C8UV79_ORBOL|nr:hypothetical protein TWF106_006466 [Orbilia oligospora]